MNRSQTQNGEENPEKNEAINLKPEQRSENTESEELDKPVKNQKRDVWKIISPVQASGSVSRHDKDRWEPGVVRENTFYGIITN